VSRPFSFLVFALRIFIKEFAAKEKLEIVIGVAPPPFGFFAGDFLAACGGENGSDYFKNTALFFPR
jgi:hypothetical protein